MSRSLKFSDFLVHELNLTFHFKYQDSTCELMTPTKHKKSFLIVTIKY